MSRQTPLELPFLLQLSSGLSLPSPSFGATFFAHYFGRHCWVKMTLEPSTSSLCQTKEKKFATKEKDRQQRIAQRLEEPLWPIQQTEITTIIPVLW